MTYRKYPIKYGTLKRNMHAYLIIGNNEKGKADNIEKLLKILKASPYEFLLNKIEDTRYLAKLTSLSINKPTAYIINDIDQATTEALNSFLKNLEEPQENLYYILTADSLAKILPTIISRCQVIKLKNLKTQEKSVPPSGWDIRNNEEIGRFLGMTVGEKLAYCDRIKDRGEAKKLAEAIINFLHSSLLETDKNQVEIAKNLEISTKTLNNLEANGNVNLQLTNMVINPV